MAGTVQGYTTGARLLHWGIAALVLLMIPAGIVMIREGLPRPVQDTLFLFHKNTGVLIGLLMLARILWRWRHPAPPLPASLPGWQRAAAGISHAALYVLLLVMPISGYVRVRAGGYPIESLDALGLGPLVGKSKPLETAAQGLHYAGFLLLVAILAVHVGAALQHALIRRDGVFGRMWPPVAPRDN